MRVATAKDIEPNRARPFLTARWENLALISYAIEPRRLEGRLPPGCELDTRDGDAFVSLVAFDFLQTRVFGLAWPGHRNFPEINLRFYVRYGDDRGVCFIREFVPRHIIAGIARWFYNEPYRAAVMSSQIEQAETTITVEHRLRVGQSRHSLRLVAAKPAVRPAESSIEHFFKEHQWGFGITRNGRQVRYRVEHPVWDIWPVQESQIQWNWTAVYGLPWAFLQDRKPCSVVLACGSEVRVYPGQAAAR
jgi:uncharacterized protein